MCILKCYLHKPKMSRMSAKFSMHAKGFTDITLINMSFLRYFKNDFFSRLPASWSRPVPTWTPSTRRACAAAPSTSLSPRQTQRSPRRSLRKVNRVLRRILYGIGSVLMYKRFMIYNWHREFGLAESPKWPLHAVSSIRDTVKFWLVTILLTYFLMAKTHKNDQLSLMNCLL